MKKLYSVLMLAAALPGFAAQTARIPVSMERSEISHREFMKQNNLLPQQTFAAAEDEENQVILTPPSDAEIKMYTRTVDGYNIRWGQSYAMHDEGVVGEIAFCENGDVYLKNPISYKPMNSWMKGKKDGNKLTFTFPQLIALLPADDGIEDSELMEVWLNVLTGQQDENGLSYYMDDTQPNEITMTIKADGSILYEEKTMDIISGSNVYTVPQRILAVTSANDEWLGFGDYYNLYEPFDTTPTLIPESLEVKDYAMIHGEAGKFVQVAFDDENNKVYIAGIYSPDDPGYESLAKSAIVGTTMVGGALFDSHQYAGIDPYYYYAFFNGGTTRVEGENTMLDVQAQFIITMTDDRSKMTSGSVIAVSEGDQQGYILEAFMYPVFDAQSGYVDPNPAEPKVTGYMPLTDEYGYGGVKVMIPNTNNNGQLLYEDRLSYSILINDKNVVFDPEQYPEFEEATPWIPFNFSSYNVEIFPYEFNTRMVFLTDEMADVQTISVQSRYKSGDSYYVTNGPRYEVKPVAPKFNPESGFAFPGETGEVTITSGDQTKVFYKVVTDGNINGDFIEGDSNVVKVTLDSNATIIAYTYRDADGKSSEQVTSFYTVTKSSVEEILSDFGGDAEIFTIDGVRVDRDVLEPGFYVVVKDGKATKVLVK